MCKAGNGNSANSGGTVGSHDIGRVVMDTCNISAFKSPLFYSFIHLPSEKADSMPVWQALSVQECRVNLPVITDVVASDGEVALLKRWSNTLWLEQHCQMWVDFLTALVYLFIMSFCEAGDGAS